MVIFAPRMFLTSLGISCLTKAAKLDKFWNKVQLELRNTEGKKFKQSTYLKSERKSIEHKFWT